MPEFIPIDDPADARTLPYRDVRERDLTGRRGFVAEGEVVLRVLIRSGRHRAASVLIDERRRASLEPLLAGLPEEAPVFLANQAVMDTIVGFHIHRGVLAVGERAAEPDPDALLAGLDGGALVLGLFGIGNHDNIGGLFRNAAAFGSDAVLLDAECCDPLYRKAIRVSVGAALSTPFVRLAAGVDMVELLRRHGFESLALSPRGRLRLADVRRPARTALLLGAEGPGLKSSVLDRAHAVAIPMAGAFDSLNVATACGIALHHLRFAAEPA